MSREDREEKARIQKLRRIMAVLDRSVLVTFKDHEAMTAALPAISGMPDVEAVSPIFNKTALVFAESEETLEAVARAMEEHPDVTKVNRKALPNPEM